MQNGEFHTHGDRVKTLQSEYTMDLLNPKDGYFAEVIRSKFTRDIAGNFKEAHEELMMAMDDLIPANGNGA